MKFNSANLLEELKKPEMANILAEFQKRKFSGQKIVFQPEIDEKDAGVFAQCIQKNQVFIVNTGSVRVYLAYEEKEFTIAILNPGDIYVSHSNAYVQTMEESTLLLIDTAVFNQRMMAVPQFAQTIIQVLGRLLKNSFSIIEGLALRDVTARLALFLLNAQEKAVVSCPESTFFITAESLALQIGASRQTVSSLLTDFTRSDILAKEKRGGISYS